jgi:hypothetical protein
MAPWLTVPREVGEASLEAPVAQRKPVFGALVERFVRHRHRLLVSAFGAATAG